MINQGEKFLKIQSSPIPVHNQLNPYLCLVKIVFINLQMGLIKKEEKYSNLLLWIVVVRKKIVKWYG